MAIARERVAEEPRIGGKKTAFVMITVVGCIAILWPKIISPMFSTAPRPAFVGRDPYSPGAGGGCCGVVLDQQGISNITGANSQATPRKRLNLMTGEMNLRQERPPHMRNTPAMHPAMRERGRAIPTDHTVPIVQRPAPSTPTSTHRIVEGRPGPLPGMRPPMGGGAMHQASQKSSGPMGFLMPLYTLAIVGFFVYTIIKLVTKKEAEPLEPSPEFKRQVFGQDANGKTAAGKGANPTNIGWKEHDTKWRGPSAIFGPSSLLGTLDQPRELPTNTQYNGYPVNSANGKPMTNGSSIAGNASSVAELEFQLRETEQLLEITLLKQKLRETEAAMSNIIAQMGTVAKDQPPAIAAPILDTPPITPSDTNRIPAAVASAVETIDDEENSPEEKRQAKKCIDDFFKKQTSAEKQPNIVRRGRDTSNDRDRSVKILGMEMTASCEGGQKWSRPPTPLLNSGDLPPAELQSIYLQGSLPHESQILVADAQTKSESVPTSNDDDYEGTEDEPAVVLSSKMTLSLISMDQIGEKNCASYDVDLEVRQLIEEVGNSDEDVEEDDEDEEEDDEDEEEDDEEEEDSDDIETLGSNVTTSRIAKK